MKNILLSLPLVLLIACRSGGHDGHGHEGGHDHMDANAHMHQSSFEDLVTRFEDPERAVWQQPEKVLDLMGDLEGRTVMEIGAGTGYFSFKVAEKGARVIAADIDERFLRYIQEKRDSLRIDPASMEVRQVPEDSPGMRPGEVDLVFMVNVYHHIGNRAEYFARVLQNLKPGGRLMIVDFKKEDTPHGPPTDMRISGEEVQQELFAAGFPVITYNDKELPEQYVLTAFKTLPGNPE